MLANHNSTELLKFTLEFDDADTLIVSHPDAEEDLVIDITRHPQDDPNSTKMELYGKKEGFKENDEINQWFT